MESSAQFVERRRVSSDAIVLGARLGRRLGRISRRSLHLLIRLADIATVSHAILIITIQRIEESHIHCSRGLLTAAIRCGGHLSVLDFGGSLGQTRFGLEWTLQHLFSPTMWCVVDQPECIEAAVPRFAANWLRFYDSVVAAAAEHEFNTVISSSTLQYLDAPYDVLDSLARLMLPNILLDRTAISDGEKELIMRQHTPADMGGDVHPLRALSRIKIDNIPCKPRI